MRILAAIAYGGLMVISGCVGSPAVSQERARLMELERRVAELEGELALLRLEEPQFAHVEAALASALYPWPNEDFLLAEQEDEPVIINLRVPRGAVLGPVWYVETEDFVRKQNWAYTLLWCLPSDFGAPNVTEQ